MRTIAAFFAAALLTVLAAPVASAGEHGNGICDSHTISKLCW
ncbi:hypothetical protein FB563_2738 [Streptomyces puniciscabiei]|uniref:Uncharacterized protein n=1 Tax=Streptomyces puniciscabiei TaxID=164348 RepID=A0A542UF94_9ACTN|nr:MULTISPECIES: hypothetical protein [Streptomyces]TQK97754.1 hypothetical protein FB563_2738 [Streptomyces puniciscabiei]